MKSGTPPEQKFAHLNFGSIQMLLQAELGKVKGGYGGGKYPTSNCQTFTCECSRRREIKWTMAACDPCDTNIATTLYCGTEGSSCVQSAA